MKLYKYIRPVPALTKTVLVKNGIYRIKDLGRYVYEVYGKDYDVLICKISPRVLNYCFEEVE